MRMAILVRIMMLTIIILKSLENSLNLWVLILMLQKMEHGCNKMSIDLEPKAIIQFGKSSSKCGVEILRKK